MVLAWFLSSDENSKEIFRNFAFNLKSAYVQYCHQVALSTIFLTPSGEKEEK
jgi:hypothetical protein